MKKVQLSDFKSSSVGVSIQSEFKIEEYPYLEEMKSNIEKAFKKHFPQGYIAVEVSKSSAGGSVLIIAVKMGLIGDEKDLYKGYRENDPMDVGLFISPKNYTQAEREPYDEVVYDAKILRSDSIAIKPEEGSYVAFSRVKIGFREVTGDLTKIEKAVIKYIEKMAKTVKSIPWEDINFQGDYPDKYYKSVK
jgi:hypothetical protein